MTTADCSAQSLNHHTNTTNEQTNRHHCCHCHQQKNQLVDHLGNSPTL